MMLGSALFVGFSLVTSNVVPINNFLHPQIKAVNCKAYVKLVDSYIVSRANVLADRIPHLTYDQFVTLKEAEEYLAQPHVCQSAVLNNWGVK